MMMMIPSAVQIKAQESTGTVRVGPRNYIINSTVVFLFSFFSICRLIPPSAERKREKRKKGKVKSGDRYTLIQQTAERVQVR
jgi:hypothetical protein